MLLSTCRGSQQTARAALQLASRILDKQPQRIHAAFWYIHSPQSDDVVTPLRPMHALQGYKEPLDKEPPQSLQRQGTSYSKAADTVASSTKSKRASPSIPSGLHVGWNALWSIYHTGNMLRLVAKVAGPDRPCGVLPSKPCAETLEIILEGSEAGLLLGSRVLLVEVLPRSYPQGPNERYYKAAWLRCKHSRIQRVWFGGIRDINP